MKNSTFGKLRSRDWWQGLLMATGTAAIVIIQNSLDAGSLTFNWKQIAMAALAGGITYISKNLFTNDVKVAEKIIAKESNKKSE